MKTDVFAYGLLMYEEVLFALTGKSFSLEPAMIDDHQRMNFVKQGWPKLAVVLPQQGATVNGVLIRNVDADTLRLLDLFEGVEDDLYWRSQVMATITAGEKVSAEIYLGTETTGILTSGVWNEAEFLKDHHRHYVEGVIPEFLRKVEHL